jgi:hypothetical protein
VRCLWCRLAPLLTETIEFIIDASAGGGTSRCDVDLTVDGVRFYFDRRASVRRIGAPTYADQPPLRALRAGVLLAGGTPAALPTRGSSVVYIFRSARRQAARSTIESVFVTWHFSTPAATRSRRDA